MDERSIDAPRNHPALRRMAVRAAPQPPMPSGPGLAHLAEAVEGRGRLDRSRDFLPAPSLQVSSLFASPSTLKGGKVCKLPSTESPGWFSPPPAASCSCNLSFFFLLPELLCHRFPFWEQFPKESEGFGISVTRGPELPSSAQQRVPRSQRESRRLAARSSADAAPGGRAAPGTCPSAELPGADSSQLCPRVYKASHLGHFTFCDAHSLKRNMKRST